MRPILSLCGGVLLLGGTAGAYVASTAGWGLPGRLKEPVSVREESVRGTTRGGHGMAYYYFVGTGRTHTGGSHNFGK